MLLQRPYRMVQSDLEVGPGNPRTNLDVRMDRRAVVDADIVAADDVGMLDLAGGAGLADEALHELLVAGEVRGEDLDRDLALHRELGRLEHRAHAALAELGDELVAGDDLRPRCLGEVAEQEFGLGGGGAAAAGRGRGAVAPATLACSVESASPPAGRGGGGAAAGVEALPPDRRAEFERRLADIDRGWPAVGRATVSDFVDGIDYVVRLIGIEHVGISSDFDGGGGIDGWNSAAETFNVTLELVRRGYTKEQIDWCRENEGLIWTYIIKNENLYTVDPVSIQNYIGEAPFTQGFSQEDSPGNIGPWIGWQIVKKFVGNNPGMKPEEVMKASPKQVLEDSKYKPK